MILQALTRYYDLLAAEPDSGIARLGYSPAKVSFAANLSPEGALLELIPVKVSRPRGKKMEEVPQIMMVPEQMKLTVNICANFLCTNAAYLFGLDTKGNPERVVRCFEAFRALHRQLLEGIDVPDAQAIVRFVERWNPREAAEHPALAANRDELNAGANLVLQLDGAHRYAHEVPEILAAWERHRQPQEDGPRGQCLVSGEVEPIARLHPSLKGVRGANPTGASIVSFNARAYESYGKDEQKGLNAPVGSRAAFAYTTALNALLADSAHRQVLGDASVVYWAETARQEHRDLFSWLVDPGLAEPRQEAARDADAERALKPVFEKIAQGRPASEGLALDPSVRFYVLGLSPNVARISVRFFLTGSFGSFIDRIGQHYADLQLQHAPSEPEYIPLWRLLSETVSPASRDKAASPLMAGAVLRAILAGAPYPQALYNQVLLRIRAEHQISYYKAAIVKACLTRKNLKPKDREGLTVALNEQSDNKAYVLGRLFSALEKAQQDANPGINATIRDRYFTSACATPGSVFPTLLKLSNHHIAKAAYGLNDRKRIQMLLDKLNVNDAPFPAHLSLEEQGLFILGYYHQAKANYAKKEEEQP